MARGGGAPKPAQNNDHRSSREPGERGPPQSTLAAQIVSNLSTTNGETRPDDRGNFEQLLSEILGAGSGSPNDDGAVETDLDVNCKLVSVVTRAGLEVLLREDPFSMAESLLPQAVNSISVIQLTIKRMPQVLFTVPNDSPRTAEKPGAPLYIWLLPKLQQLLGYTTAEGIQESLLELLSTVLHPKKESPGTWHDLGMLTRYYQACITAVLSSLETTLGASSKAGIAQYKAVLPPTHFLSDEFPESFDPFTDDETHQLSVRDPAQAATIALSLLCAFAFPVESKSNALAESRSLIISSWALDCLTRFRVVLERFIGTTGRQGHHAGIYLLLRAFRYSASHVVLQRRNQVHARRAAATWAQAIAGFLQWSANDLDALLQQELCAALLDLSKASESQEVVRGILSEGLLPALLPLGNDSARLNALNDDLKSSIGIFSRRMLLTKSIPTKVRDVLNLLAGGEKPLGNPDLKLQSDDLHLNLWKDHEGLDDRTHEDRVDQEGNQHLPHSAPYPAVKRRRLTSLHDQGSPLEVAGELTGNVYRLLGSQPATDLEGLHLVAVNCFATLSGSEQCEAFDSLGMLACASAGALESCANRGFKCQTCDSDLTLRPHGRFWLSDQSAVAFSTLSQLLQSAEFQKSTKPRVCAMLALRRLVSHAEDVSLLKLADSPLGQWCLRSLHSSLRELRIAAGRALPAFLRADMDQDHLAQNRRVALNFLRELAEKNELGFQETCVLAWAQVARVCSDNELNIVLLRLVEYLGHPNAMVHGVAFLELSNLSKVLNTSPRCLLTPFWRNIAVTVVRDLQTRPQTTQLLCDLLLMSVPDFLVLTQTHTLPYLVMCKKQDVMSKIVQARGGTTTVGSICFETVNLASILALLLLQGWSDTEKAVMELLRHASADFGTVNLPDLVRIEPILIAFELLKAAGDENDGKKAQVYEAIHVLATLATPKAGQLKASSRKSALIGPFFEAHVLGIMAQFSDVVNDIRVQQPYLEKKRCLRGVEEMIKLGKGHTSNALPQICACLQSALAIDTLRVQAFSTWSTMMTSLDGDDIEGMIEGTFAIVVEYWELLPSATHQQASGMIGHLVKKHMGLIKANINCMPSLSSIPLLSKLDTEIRKHKAQLDTRHRYLSFSSRCQHENVTVVKRALVELVHYLRQNQSFLHVSVVSEQPDPVVSELVRSILDACIKFTGGQPDIARLCAECIGLIGCLDPNRVEAVRENRDIVVVSNFEQADETIDWVMFFMQEVIVRAFMSATNTKAQGFLAFAMQELLKFCGFDASVTFRTRDMHTNATYRRWIALPEAVRNTLTPFLTSKYVVAVIVTKPEWPIFNSKLGHGAWLRTLVFDLLQKGTGENPTMLFPVCSRVIRGQDISISNFLLPFVALNVIIGGTEAQVMEVGRELLTVLGHQIDDGSHTEKENLKLCSESVFQVLDYLSRWILEEKKEMSTSRSAARQGARSHAEDTKPQESAKIRRVELVLGMIPAEVISRRAVDCRSFARALFHWEQYIRQNRGSLEAPTAQPEMEPLYERLQDIYTQIDEPDGIEGISAHLHVLHIDQQILEHRKAGRWAAARSWYELQLAEQPENVDLQVSLLTCLRESGQHDVLLNQVDGMPQTPATVSKVLPFAVEASWVTGQWTKLEKYLGDGQATESADFNVTIGRALLSLRREDTAEFTRTVHTLQADIAKILSRSSTSSLQACHHDLLKFHVLAEMELLSGEGQESSQVKISSIMDTLDQRLEVLGAFLSDKQYLLGVRRAVMQVSKLPFGSEHVASLWLTSARLARKGNLTQQSFNAVLHASKLGAESATIEHSRLLWKEGQHRKAIRSLEGAIAVNAFRSYNYAARDDAATSLAGEQNEQQNLLTARAHLLLAKWLDSAGQTQSQGIIHRYQVAARAHLRWEKGHYYLGRHYNKLFESEKARPHNKQAQPFITGETAKLVIQSYLRSLTFGAKYIFQTLPRMLTLWLDLGFEVHSPVDSKYGTGKGFQDALFDARRAQLDQVHVSLKKYMEVLPAYMFYTALAQIVARICHPNKEVLGILQDIIVKVVSTHPQQALWTLLAVVKSSAKDRAARGAACLSRIKGDTRRTKASAAGLELKTMVMQGQKLSAQLLDVCDGEIQGKPSSVSLSRDLGFSHKTAPCPLVVPLEATLTASLPTIPDTIKSHKSFAGDAVTILSFLDDVLVLNSLQRPRKISVRGSDGKVYGLLCKPKDDLRKDQRLMEFNAMINRSLKRDAESSKRRLYIKTYAVTPLNEECGLIEWVDNLKTLRDILLKLYKAKGVYPNYPEIRNLLDEADSHASKTPIFTKRILPCFPPVFHEWFVEMFPEPGAWFTARLKYTRSCAVMSMVGMVLGLGDRHGENILFEEGNGGTFHVDFNCLFDKGLTFEKPEMVPFRLTHNMVDAFGVYGYEGPFRKSCELTLQILRQNEDTLMTILETFVYDPTTDFIGKKKRTTANVPDTPQEVLDSVRGKVRGLLKGESVPLSVEGHVHELIQQAVSPRYLAAMYIGWCAFF